MTQQQIDLLSEDEKDMLLYILNQVFPVAFPKMEFDLHTIKWHRHDLLMKKIIETFPHLKPEGHSIYSSLLTKLGVQHEIKYEQPKAPVTSSAAETTG